MPPFFSKLLKLLPHAAYTRLHEARQNRRDASVPPSRLSAYIRYLNRAHPAFSVSLLDVGARFGIADSELGPLLELRDLRLTGIEPDAREANRLENLPGPGRFAKVYPVAAWSFTGEGVLHVTRHPGCTSVLEPDAGQLRPYRIAGWFEVARKFPVSLITLNDLLPPDARFDLIKIDVQGGEYDVLTGGQRLLAGSTALMLESHLIPLYKKQHTLDSLHRLCADAGFRLIHLTSAPTFDGEVAEVNCVYLKGGETALTKDDLLKRVLFSALVDNFAFAELLLRNWGAKLLNPDELRDVLQALDLTLQSPWPMAASTDDPAAGGGFGGTTAQ